MQLNADIMLYVVPAKIIDDFGVTIQGVGTSPILIIANSDSNTAIGFFGDATIQTARQIVTENGGVNEVVHQYFHNEGLSDFNDSCEIELEADQIVQLVQGIIDQDVGDFVEEAEMSCLLIEPDAFRDEEFLADQLNHFGIWVSKNETAEISFDSSTNEITVDGDVYGDWQELASEKLIDSDDNYMGCIT